MCIYFTGGVPPIVFQKQKAEADTAKMFNVQKNARTKQICAAIGDINYYTFNMLDQVTDFKKIHGNILLPDLSTMSRPRQYQQQILKS